MEHAKVICHMFISIDGKIQNHFGNNPDADYAAEFYEKLNCSYGQAIGISRNTVDSGVRPDQKKYKGRIMEYRDRVIRDNCIYGVIFDRYGKMCWDSEYQQIPNLPKRRIIEVLTQQTPMEYLAYLEERNIPFLFDGKKDLDLFLVLQKLRYEYGIETMVFGGGSTLNSAFFSAGLVDEISLVIAPGINGRRSSLGIASTEDSAAFPQFYQLKYAESIGHNSLLLRYVR